MFRVRTNLYLDSKGSSRKVSDSKRLWASQTCDHDHPSESNQSLNLAAVQPNVGLHCELHNVKMLSRISILKNSHREAVQTLTQLELGLYHLLCCTITRRCWIKERCQIYFYMKIDSFDRTTYCSLQWFCSVTYPENNVVLSAWQLLVCCRISTCNFLKFA